MAKAKFIKFVGGAWLYGKDVAAYETADGIKLTPESTGGKVIGASVTVNPEEFESLQDQWTEGGALYPHDARITAAALRYVGIDI